MRHSILCNSKHLQNITPKSTLHHIKINLRNVLAHDLLRGVVDEDVQRTEFLHVLLDGFAAGFVVHEVSWDEEALLAFLFDHALGFLGVLLFFGEVDDCYVGAFAGEEDCDGTAYARAVKFVR